ncbi:beta-glucosidase family protein [Candidatus Xianfuyuplasma coldseepsis]|uniref:Glycosyl hydrolase n=1 Tax=Candidatus Xianfuyuplasma coldseepsis TaxID=2782163 RepID=A0A7L7KQG0_9MOLU|nr:glycoside hydrolase family 3 C-terminal domain-containing protein [Xianfuyuplasma coldseepsis]QMS84669.1 glycosyl hydrolase [Xianfuyuplasma coldseepsis]
MSQKARDLVQQMTLEEKASLLSGQDFWYLESIERLGLPSIMVTDGPHGLRKQAGNVDMVGLQNSVPATCYPTASLLASTWDVDLLTSLGEHLGDECLSEKVSVLLGPGVNIKRHPLCGRNFEYFSEDPVLSGELAAAFINGVQSKGIGTSLKHFVANNQETMRMAIDTIVDERTLKELYLRSFEIAVKKAQPWTVMNSYNKVNGLYMSEHPTLLNHTLKNKWKHTGLVVTDWGACNNRVKGIIAGQDLEMPGSLGINNKKVIAAVQNGELEESIVDQRVERIVDLILQAKETLEKPSFSYDKDKHHDFARHVATQGIVLLKNTGVLPLDSTQRIALIGGFAEHPRYQGSGSSLINPTIVSTAKEAFEQRLGDRLLYAKGYDVATDQIDNTLIQTAVEVAKQADVVVIMAGLTDAYESEGFDRDHLHLPMNHNALIDAITEVHDQVIVTLSNGSPVTMPWKDNVQAIVEQYLSGQASGEAIANILFGEVNPSGKLAETFPNTLSEFPSNQHFPGQGRQVQYREGLYVGYRAYDSMTIEPLFPFGFGLSYTTFDYSNGQVESTKDTITVQIDVTNSGSVLGKEIVQVYVKKKNSVVYRPEKELKGFTKIELQPGETQTVTVTIPLFTLKIFNETSHKLEAGAYHILVGASSRDIRYSTTINIVSDDIINHDNVDAYTNISSTFEPSLDSFEELLGHSVPPIQPTTPYHINSTVGEVKNTFIGKQLHKIIQKNLGDIMGGDGSGDDMHQGSKRMIEKMVDEIPLRGLMMFSQGKLSEGRMYGMIEMMNKKYLKGLFHIIKG